MQSAKILDYKTEEKNVDAAINELDGKIHASKEKMEELEELKSIDEEANEWKKRVQGDQNQTEEEKKVKPSIKRSSTRKAREIRK